MTQSPPISPATLKRLSVYLRFLRKLQREGAGIVSSLELADGLHLSPAQIRRDLGQLGDFGIRGVGYQIDDLAERIYRLLDLDKDHPLVIVGMGALGSALAGFIDFNDDSFHVVAGFDIDPAKVNRIWRGLPIHEVSALAPTVEEIGAKIAVLTVPPEAAVECYEALAAAGIRAVLNFVPVTLPERETVELKNVDLRTYLEETSFLLRSVEDPEGGELVEPKGIDTER